MTTTDYSQMTVDELHAEANRLAEQRTAIRLQQNAIQAELEIRKALEGMSGAAQQALRVRLEGGVKPTSVTAEAEA